MLIASLTVIFVLVGVGAYFTAAPRSSRWMTKRKYQSIDYMNNTVTNELKNHHRR